MSALEGKFKSELMYFETSKEGAKPNIRAIFKLKEEYLKATDEWIPLVGVENTIASKTYWLNKTKFKESDEQTTFEKTVERFEKDFGGNLTLFGTVDELKEAFGGAKRVLVLEPDESDFHKVQYVNHVNGPRKVKEGLASLQSLL
tara:strand:+ start:280 stop:714 length:435 start_codon:yes stop_codon:yes gene_type:complete